VARGHHGGEGGPPTAPGDPPQCDGAALFQVSKGIIFLQFYASWVFFQVIPGMPLLHGINTSGTNSKQYDFMCSGPRIRGHPILTELVLNPNPKI
jgi:hypothetical protein